jgi:hypothetical protein
MEEVRMRMWIDLRAAVAAVAVSVACSSSEDPRLSLSREAVSGAGSSGGYSGGSSGGSTSGPPAGSSGGAAGAPSGGTSGGSGSGSGGTAQGGFPGFGPDYHPNCDEGSREKRIQDETNLVQQMSRNHCMPDNFAAEPCKGLGDQWAEIKLANAYCNSKGAYCEYFLALVKKYKDLQKQLCPPPPGAAGQPGPTKQFKDAGLTYQDFCDHVALSLKHYKMMASGMCGHSWCDATREFQFTPDDPDCPPLGGLCCYPHDGCYHVGSDGTGSCSADLGC